MNFDELTIDRFGVWRKLHLGKFSPGPNVLFGPNEAGKSTLLEFCRGVLYGFTPKREAYLIDREGGPSGGTLVGTRSQSRVRIARRLRSPESIDGAPANADRVEWLDVSVDDHPWPSTQLDDLLDGIDGAVFENVFAVGLDEMQELGTLSGSEAARMLADLSTGISRRSLGEALEELAAGRERLLSPTGQQGQIAELRARRGRLLDSARQAAAATDQYARLNQECSSLDAELATVDEEHREAARELARLEAVERVREPWQERQAIDERLAGLGSIPDLPPDALARMRALETSLVRLRRRRKKLATSHKRLRADRTTISPQDRLWRQSARIQALAEHDAWLATLEQQVREGAALVAQFDKRVQQERERLGLSGNPTAPAPTGFSPRNLLALRAPAAALRETRRRSKITRQEIVSHRDAQGHERRQMQTVLAGRGNSDLTTALARQGELVAAYRRRLQLDDRLDQLALHKEETTENLADQELRQVLPLWVLCVLGAFVVVGGGLVLAGLVLGSGMLGPARWPMVIFGALGAGGAILSKYWLEKTAEDNLESLDKQLAMLEGQITSAKQERDELDESLPQGGGSLTSRLQAAEAELKALEDLLPANARQTTAEQEWQALRERAKTAHDDYRKARRRWEQALASLDLPTDWTPARVRQLAQQAADWQQLQRQSDQAREDLDRKKKELAALATRIDQLCADAGWERPAANAASPTGPLETLRALRRALRTEEDLVARRETLDRRLSRLRRLRGSIDRRGRLVARRRRKLLSAAGVADRKEFERQSHLRVEWDRLVARRADLDRVIREALANDSLDHASAPLFHHLESTLVAESRRMAADRLQALTIRLSQLQNRREAVLRERLALAEDRSHAERELELATLDARLDEAAARWRTLAATQAALEQVRDEYERERQPATLRAASKYLAALTRGDFLRVWAPFGEHTLRVDRISGESLPVEALSRGAREQLFLALRLALVDWYAGQGKSLPMILDDVLVNFDADRTAAAIEVLCEFCARGRQLLFFTCHEHLARQFLDRGVGVLRLPGRDAPDRQPRLWNAPQLLEAPILERPRLEVAMPQAPPSPVARPKRKPVNVSFEPHTETVAADHAAPSFQAAALAPSSPWLPPIAQVAIAEAVDLESLRRRSPAPVFIPPPEPAPERPSELSLTAAPPVHRPSPRPLPRPALEQAVAEQPHEFASAGSVGVMRQPPRSGRKRRTDPPHTPRGKAVRSLSWSAEEFEGELADKVRHNDGSVQINGWEDAEAGSTGRELE